MKYISGRLAICVLIITLTWFCGQGRTTASPADTASGTGVTQAAGNGRTGWYPNQPQLSPADVNSPEFGLRWTAQVRGQIYAQPLAHNDTIVVATEDNVVAGIDQATGTLRWTVVLAEPVDGASLGCTDLLPRIGVTGTPVIDPSTNTVYVAAKSVSAGQPVVKLHALDVNTGALRPGWPVIIEGAASNDPAHRFDPKWANQRPGLLLLDGVVYMAFASHCDLGDYAGWVVGVGVDAKLRSLWSAYADTKRSGAGIWQSGSGIASDGPATMIVTTGNGFGPSSSTLGNDIRGPLAQSVVRLRVQPDATLKATDFFSPYDAARLDAIDGDLGASAPVVLPDSFGSAQFPHLLFQSSKTGYAYLLNRDDLGGRGTGASAGDRVLSRVGPHGGQWGRAAVWPGDGGWIYTVTNTKELVMNAYRVVIGTDGRPQLVLKARSVERFGKLSGSPVVTSDATIGGSALVWAIHESGPDGSGAELRAFSAGVDNSILRVVWRATIGVATKFSSPLPVGGQIVVGTREGKVMAFGRPSQQEFRVAATPSAAVIVGQRTSVVLNVASSSSGTVRIDRVDGPGAPRMASAPVSIVPGGSVTIPITVAVLGPGQSSVTLLLRGVREGVAERDREVALPVTVSLGGVVDGAAFNLDPAVVSFGGLAVDAPVATATVTLTNQGSAPANIVSVTLSGGPFSVVEAPAPGTVVGPGAAIPISVVVTPVTAGEFSSTLSVTTSIGVFSTELTATVGKAGVLTVGPLTVDVGPVKVGRSAIVNVRFANTGGAPLTITRSKGPGRNGFSVVSDVSEGTTLEPGATRTALVRFSATRPGTFRDVWSINADAPSSARSIIFSATATGTTPGRHSGAAPLRSASLLARPHGALRLRSGRHQYAFTASSSDAPGRPIASTEGSRP